MELKKPTISSAFADRASGSYYEFLRDGTVIHRFLFNGVKLTNYWFDDFPEYCSLCRSLDWHEHYTPAYGYCSEHCAEVPISCQTCSSSCRGGDYENWGFCSRSCMRDSYRDY